MDLPGDDHIPLLGVSIADEIEEFLTGVRPVPDRDSQLATVLFTDIAGSTERAADVGDHAWTAVLELRRSPGEVLVSSTVRDPVAGSGFTFSEAGDHSLQGVPGTWRLFIVDDE